MSHDLTENLKKSVDEVVILKRRLRETETRLAARLLKILKSKVGDKQFRDIESVFNAEVNLDVLEEERDARMRANDKSAHLKKVFDAVVDLREIAERCSIAPGPDEEEQRDFAQAQQKYGFMMQQIFSLVDEFLIQESYGLSTISPDG